MPTSSPIDLYADIGSPRRETLPALVEEGHWGDTPDSFYMMVYDLFDPPTEEELELRRRYPLGRMNRRRYRQINSPAARRRLDFEEDDN